MNFFTLKGVIRLDKKIFPHTFSLEASYRGLDQGSRELPPCCSLPAFLFLLSVILCFLCLLSPCFSEEGCS